jgi:hypothetical protein
MAGQKTAIGFICICQRSVMVPVVGVDRPIPSPFAIPAQERLPDLSNPSNSNAFPDLDMERLSLSLPVPARAVFCGAFSSKKEYPRTRLAEVPPRSSSGLSRGSRRRDTTASAGKPSRHQPW